MNSFHDSRAQNQVGTLARIASKPLDPTRSRIVERARALRLGLKELSLKLGRNPSYLQQFIARGSPRRLPEEVRHTLAALLGLPETELHVEAPPQPPRSAPQAPCRPRLYLEGEDRIALGAPALRPLDGPVERGTVAVMLAEARGLLQPRHVVLCEPGEPCRPGDVVLVVEAGRVLGLGLLRTASRDLLGWEEAGALRQAAHPAATAWRIVAIRTD